MTDIDTSTLTEDGDTLELPDGVTVTLIVRPDEYQSGMDYINGMDCMGKVAWVDDRRNRYSDNPAPRPDGFTGAARKITTGYGDSYWWEPYREGHTVYWDREQQDAVRDLLMYGPYEIALKFRKRCECCGTVNTIHEQWLGGIDSAEYAAECVAELFDEALYEMKETNP